jgi:Gram-negative bacterial TonB protein C-terminal
VTGLHWYVLATQVRCHTVQFVFTSSEPRLIEGLLHAMSETTLEEGAAPVCVKDYASGDNVIKRVQPFFAERRFNAVPVRLIIDTAGKVKHIHFLSAFPDQAKAVTDALLQWQFKPYSVNGQPVEVETGILFGRTAAARQ